MNKTFVTIIILIIIGALGYWLFAGDSEPTVDENETDETAEEETENVVEENEDEDEEEQVKEFNLTGENFAFSEDELVVNEGDLVRVTFSSTQGTHDFVIDEFDVETDTVDPKDGEVVIEFIADQAGEFEYYCSVGNHREQGMFGTLIVE